MSTLWVVGDSTLSSFYDKYYYPRYGYGTKLGCYLNSKVQVNNLALSGRSSLSFTKEENYKELLAGMKAGDYTNTVYTYCKKNCNRRVDKAGTSYN